MKLSDNTTIKQVFSDSRRDRLEVEIGDAKQKIFYPQIKIKRWDNECNFSVRLVNNDPDTARVFIEGKKVIWRKDKIEAQVYPTGKLGEESSGLEFEIILKEKPTTNKLEFTVESKGLIFSYQPKRTQKEKDRGATRPANVVGSYAAYHETKTGDFSPLGGKNYKTGKAFHIFRPQMVDNSGWKVWGELSIDTKKKIQTIIIPQEFLDRAIYPVRHASGQTFGWTGKGTSLTGIDNKIYANKYMGAVGSLSKISAFLKCDQAGGLWKFALYKESDDSLVAQTAEGSGIIDGLSELSAGSQSVSEIDYLISVWGGNVLNDPRIYYDYTSFKVWYKASVAYNGIYPTPTISWTLEDFDLSIKLSIYATYSIVAPSPNFTHRNNFSGYLAFIQQYIRHRINGTTPWKNPDGTLL